MRKTYDFTKGEKNPYIHKLKKSVTIRLDDEVINYFKNIAAEKGVPYQSLINLYLKDCAAKQKVPDLSWS